MSSPTSTPCYLDQGCLSVCCVLQSSLATHTAFHFIYITNMGTSMIWCQTITLISSFGNTTASTGNNWKMVEHYLVILSAIHCSLSFWALNMTEDKSCSKETFFNEVVGGLCISLLCGSVTWRTTGREVPLHRIVLSIVTHPARKRMRKPAWWIESGQLHSARVFSMLVWQGRTHTVLPIDSSSCPQGYMIWGEPCSTNDYWERRGQRNKPSTGSPAMKWSANLAPACQWICLI